MKLQYRIQSSHYILEEKIIIYFVSMLVEYIVWLLFGSICGGGKTGLTFTVCSEVLLVT